MNSENPILDLYKLNIPETEEVELGFLEISGQSHRETVNSHIYAWFLNHEQVGLTFQKALLSLLENHFPDKELLFEEFHCDTEVTTVDGKSIDLLILSDGTSKDERAEEKSGTRNEVAPPSAIIIENKLFHHLSNDLQSYWNHIECDESQKAGILLTLSKTSIPAEFEGRYINICHYEWIDRIKDLGLPAGLSPRVYVYLNDFFKTIENLSQSRTMNEQAKFYFDHTEVVNKAIKTYDAAFEHVINQLRLVAENVGWTLYGNSEYYRQIWDKESARQAYYTIIIEHIFDSELDITIMIELYKDARNKTELLDKALEGNEQMKHLEAGRTSPYWVQYRIKTYKLTKEEIINLADFVTKCIEQDFGSVMETVLKTIEAD